MGRVLDERTQDTLRFASESLQKAMMLLRRTRRWKKNTGRFSRRILRRCRRLRRRRHGTACLRTKSRTSDGFPACATARRKRLKRAQKAPQGRLRGHPGRAAGILCGGGDGRSGFAEKRHLPSGAFFSCCVRLTKRLQRKTAAKASGLFRPRARDDRAFVYKGRQIKPDGARNIRGVPRDSGR